MLTLTIGNSMSHLAGLTVSQHAEVKKLLSYRKAVQYGSGQQRRDVTLLSKRGEFPTGLLYLVEEWLDKIPDVTREIDTRQKPTEYRHAIQGRYAHTPYPEQEDVAAACAKHHRGIISAPTGSGKTLMIALIIDRLKVKTLVVVPKLELKRQTHADLRAIFGEEGMRHITVQNIDALDPKTQADYDCVIIDEFHHAAAATYRKLNKRAWTNVYYRFGLTATPFRSDEDERLLLESVLSQVIYRITYQEAVRKGYIVPVEAYYVIVPPSHTDAYSWAEVYEALVTDNAPRNALIASLLELLEGKSVLCLVKEVEHGDAIASLGPDQPYYFAHGQNPDTPYLIQLFSSGICKRLVGTTGVVAEGVDTRACEYVIVTGLGKSRNAFMQMVGRAVRKYPGKESAKIIIFKDNSHRWTKSHFAAQVKVLKEEYGCVPVELKLL